MMQELRKIQIVPIRQLRHNDIVVRVNNNNMEIVGVVTNIRRAGLDYSTTSAYIESLRDGGKDVSTIFTVKHPLTGKEWYYEKESDQVCHILRDTNTVIKETPKEDSSGIMFVDYIDDDGRRKGMTVDAGKSLSEIEDLVQLSKESYILVTLDQTEYGISFSEKMTVEQAKQALHSITSSGILWGGNSGVFGNYRYWFINTKDLWRVERIYTQSNVTKFINFMSEIETLP